MMKINEKIEVYTEFAHLEGTEGGDAIIALCNTIPTLQSASCDEVIPTILLLAQHLCLIWMSCMISEEVGVTEEYWDRLKYRIITT